MSRSIYAKAALVVILWLIAFAGMFKAHYAAAILVLEIPIGIAGVFLLMWAFVWLIFAGEKDDDERRRERLQALWIFLGALILLIGEYPLNIGIKGLHRFLYG